MKTVFNVMLLLVVIVSATAFSSCKEKRGELKKIWYNGSYNRDFNDLNDVHLSVAKKIGIEPVSSREGAEHASRDMVEIKTNDYYEVEELTPLFRIWCRKPLICWRISGKTSKTH